MIKARMLATSTAITMAACLMAVPGFAQEVRLIGKDSNINMVGKLLSARDGKFLVETEIGEFVIDQALVTCEGEGCPTELNLTYDLEIAAPDEIAEVMIPILAEGYAAASLDAEAEFLDENGQRVDTESQSVGDHKFGEERDFALKIADYEGEDVATFGIHTANGNRLFERLARKEASIIITETAARKAQRAIVADSGGGDLRDFQQERVIAVDGFAMVVNPLNTIPSLTVEQARDMFTGKITNWSEVGGSNAPITLYSFDPDTEAFHHVEELLFDGSDDALTENSNVVHSARELVTAVTGDVSGFGIVNFSRKRDTRAVPVRSECGIIQEPSAFNLKSEEYALQNRVIAYNRTDLGGYGSEFVNYLESGDLDGLVAKAGYVDLSVVTDPQDRAIKRLSAELEEGDNEFETEIVEDLLKTMNTHARMSTTFRFAPGSSALDNKGQRDLMRAVNYLRDHKPSEVIVVGFTDDKGPFDPNLLISQERAEAVMQDLMSAASGGELDGVDVKAKGFGELEPVACNTNPHGRATNRRVEIWVKS